MKSNYGAADWSFHTRGKVSPPTPPPRIVWLGVAALCAQEEVFIMRAKQANTPRNVIWPQGRRHLDSTGYSRGGAETQPPTNSAPSVCIYLAPIQIAMFRTQCSSPG